MQATERRASLTCHHSTYRESWGLIGPCILSSVQLPLLLHWGATAKLALWHPDAVLQRGSMVDVPPDLLGQMIERQGL
jgi:hypothetical protein